MVFKAPNNDSQWSDLSGLYSKGLKQAGPGKVDPAVGAAFLDTIARGVNATGPNDLPIVNPPLFEEAGIALGNPMGRLNGPQAAFARQLVGDDSRTFATIAPPPVGGPHYAVELAELYWASLLRDAHFSDFYSPQGPQGPYAGLIQQACDDLTKWAKQDLYFGPTTAAKEVTPALLFRGGVPAGKRTDFKNGAPQVVDSLRYFRGETVGPYVSQLCLVPTKLGALTLDQRVSTLAPARDYMFDLDAWLAVQNGARPGEPDMDPVARHVRNGRDLAAYTRVDELYQAYLAAFLVLSAWKAPANPGLPYDGYRNQKPFCTLGGPEIAGFIGTVAHSAIKAVWWQKWAVHLRARPEAGGGLVHLRKTQAPANLPAAAKGVDPAFDEILKSSVEASAAHYSPRGVPADKRTYLLSQAFPEGSPTHPAYPTGHGTVAGACITVLKFFFDGSTRIIELAAPMVAAPDGLSLLPYPHADAVDMDVNGELHKLAHNISFGHGVHAGIHWRSDTDESMLLGERVAVSCLKKLVKTYAEKVNVTIAGMNGEPISIAN